MYAAPGEVVTISGFTEDMFGKVEVRVIATHCHRPRSLLYLNLAFVFARRAEYFKL